MPSSLTTAIPPIEGLSSNAALTRSNLNIKAKSSEFESILLTQWLQSAQATFGSAPGGSDEKDPDAQQWTGFAVQQLAKGISDRGGIGIGKMVERALLKSETPSAAHSDDTRAKAASR